MSRRDDSQSMLIMGASPAIVGQRSVFAPSAGSERVPSPGSHRFRPPPAMRLAASAIAVAFAAAGGCGDGGSPAGPDDPPPATPPVVTVVSGDAQRAVVTLPLAQPVVVRVATGGTATPGASVSFQVVRGGGSVDPSSATTDGSGEARTTWTMGSTSGEGELSITATAAGRASVAVSARATADAAREALLTVIDGGSQQAVVSTAVPVAPLVRVRDSSGTALAGVRVTFTVTGGGGAVLGGSALTDIQGIARAERWTLGSVPGENRLQVSVGGAWAAPPVMLTATGVAAGGLALHPPRPYPVAVAAGGSVLDSITGARFVFPAGGSGTLAVTRVADGRAVPYGVGATALVEWSGTQDVQVAMGRAAGAEPNAMLWGVPRHSMEGGGQAQWLALPRLRESGDSVVFGLTSGTRLIEEAQPSPASVGAGSFAPAGLGRSMLAAVRLAASTQQVAQLRALEAEARAAVTNLRQIAAAQFWQRWDQSVTAAPLTFSWSWPGLVSDCVSRYSGRISSGGPVIEFCASSVAGRGFHEAGHYVTELLGIAAQRDGNPVLDLAPGEIDASQAHDWGSSWWGFRKTITEDYAFFSQMVSGGGLIDGVAVDGSSPDFYFTRLAERRSPTGGSLGRQQPATVDYPTIEGFGIAMMAALHRGSTSAHDFSSDPSAPSIVGVPALALPYGLLVAALAHVPTTIDGLLGAIEAELQVQGFPAGILDDMPVTLEAVGWSYNGSVRVLRPGSPPVPVTGATARVGIKGSNSKEYLLPPVGPSGTDGRITLPRLFPGKPYFVRVYLPTSSGAPRDSADFGFAGISRLRATTQSFPEVELILPSAVEVNVIVPNPALVGETVLVTGTGFGTTPGDLRFASYVIGGAAILSWTATQITFRVPSGIPIVSDRLTVRRPDGASGSAPFVVAQGLSLDAFTGPTFLGSWDGSAPVSYQVVVSGGTGAYTVRWSSLSLDVSGTATTFSTTVGKLGMEAGSPLRWLYVTVTDAAGKSATWRSETGQLETEFAYGVGLGSASAPNCAVRGVPAPPPPAVPTCRVLMTH